MFGDSHLQASLETLLFEQDKPNEAKIPRGSTGGSVN